MMKLLPRSISNFDTIIKQDYVYIDKTKFIKIYEESNELISLFLRPRRFGKTLFTEILKYYYDQSLVTEADNLFKNTYIASHTTPLKGNYYVLKIDFSGINLNDFERTFNLRFLDAINDFYARYPQFSYENYYAIRHETDQCQNPLKETTAIGALNIFLYNYSTQAPRNDKKLMIIIDEYDNFPNDILSEDVDFFYKIANKQGFIGIFYQTLRNYFQNGTIGRIFITGITQITLDTAVSGFVYNNISSDLAFNEVAGFTSDEINLLLDQAIDFDICPYKKEEIIADMQQKYNGYKFSKRAKQGLFNSALCLNYLDSFVKDDYETIPDLKTALNFGVDYNKLQGYMNLFSKEEQDFIYNSIMNNIPIPIVFPENMKLDSNHLFSSDHARALLFALGYLTFMTKEECQEYFGDDYMGGTYLKVPNKYFLMLFAKFYLTAQRIEWNELRDLNRIAYLERTNDVSCLKNVLSKIASGFVNTDITHENEASVVMAIYTAFVLNTQKFYLQREYPIRNEEHLTVDVQSQSIGTHSKRADLIAINHDQHKPSYIFEFKYARNRNTTIESKEQTKHHLLTEAISQLQEYTKDSFLSTIDNLHKYVIMYAFGEFYIEEVLTK